MKELYLDSNAHVSLSDAAKSIYNNFSHVGHPSALHMVGRKSALMYEQARAKIAELIGATSSNQIIFTSSCTQAAEWATKIFINSNTKPNKIYSPLEHVAVRDPIELNGCWQINVDLNGNLLENNFYKKSLCCIHSHNEFGTIQKFKNLNFDFLFSDMSQTLGKEKMNVTDLNVDLAIFGAHKFGGPTGVGFMYLKNPALWEEFGTGGRYFFDRSGTPDVLGVVATSVALENAIQTLEQRQTNMIEFHLTIEDGLEKRGARILAKNANRLKNTTFFYLKNLAADKMFKMSEKGIYFGLGSACGSAHSDISTSLKAIGETGAFCDYARISSWGEYNKKDAEYFLDIFDKV